MLVFFITLLSISQIVSFYLIFNKIKPIIKNKPEGVFLKSIPERPTYESVDPNHKLIYDVMESVKLENWKVDIEADVSYHSKTWQVNFESPTGIRIRSRIRSYNLSDNDVILGSFTILSDKGSRISIDDKSKISNDVLIFIWGYILEYYQNENDESRIYFESTINYISSKLKTLRRSEKLNDILKQNNN
jgi:hypothetical protein